MAATQEENRSRIANALPRKKPLSPTQQRRAEGFLVHHIQGLVPKSELKTSKSGSRNHRHEANGDLKRVVHVTQNNDFVHVTAEIIPTKTDDRSGAIVSGRLIEGQWSNIQVSFTRKRHTPASDVTGPRAIHQAIEHFGTRNPQRNK